MKAQTRRLKKSKLLFNKVGKSKQIRKMAVTPVLTMLTSPFWSHFASLDCPRQISKNPRGLISFIEKLKNAPFNSFILIFLILKPLKLMILYSSEGQLWPNLKKYLHYFAERPKLRHILPSCQIFYVMIWVNTFYFFLAKNSWWKWLKMLCKPILW